MKVLLLICLATGFVNSAILDSSKSPISKNSQWDDEDSMILAPSTTSNTIPSITTNKNSNDTDATTPPPTPTETSTDTEDLITGEQNRPRFISLIPAGTHKVNENTILSKSDQEGRNQEDKMKYQIYSDSTPKVEEEYITSSSSDDGGDSTTPPSSSSSEEEDDVSTSEAQGTTEKSQSRPQLKHITLGKIPLTYQIIPLLPPREENQQLLGREDTTPIGFFPPEIQGSTVQQEEMMTDKAKREQQPTTTTSSESEGEGEIITGKPVPELQELPPEPLTYMVPPQKEYDGETTVIWNLYPSTTDTDTYTNADLTSPQSTINPLLERINDFLMKAKRHSLETETTTTTDEAPPTTTTSTEENDQNTEKMETTTSTENDDFSNDISTTPIENHFAISDTPEDSNGDLNPSPPVPIPEEPTEEIYTTTRHHPPTTTIQYPTPNIPEIQDYYQPPQSPPESPITYFTPPPPPPPQQTTQNILQFPPPSSPDQYFSDYSNINTLQQEQQPISPFYYTNANPSTSNSAATLLRRRLMIQALLNKLASSMPSSSTTTPPPPSQPIYIPNDSYWPSKYFNNRGSSMNTNNMFAPPAPASASNFNTNYPNYQTNYQTNYNPYVNPSNNAGGFSRNYFPQQQQNSYVFPQQQQTTAIPLQAALNVIAASSEEPSYSPYGGSFGGGVDDYSPSIPSSSSFGRGSPYNSNPYYPSSSSTQYRRSSDGYNNYINNDNYYSSSSYYPSSYSSSTQGSAYDANYRAPIPYRPYQYPVTSSELVNRLMYAPLYPYEQYNRRMNMRTAGFY